MTEPAPPQSADAPERALAQVTALVTEQVTALVTTRGPRAGRTVVVAVDGPSGSGKTTLARALVAAWNCPSPGRGTDSGREGGVDGPADGTPSRTPGGPADGRVVGGAALLSMDALYPGWDGLAAAPVLLVEHVLGPLRRGEPASHPRWDWSADDWARGPDGAPEQVPVPGAALLVVEGCGSGARAGADVLSALVWLDGPPALRRARALARDGNAYRPHWERWAAQERAHFASEGTERRADLVLRTP